MWRSARSGRGQAQGRGTQRREPPGAAPSSGANRCAAPGRTTGAARPSNPTGSGLSGLSRTCAPIAGASSPDCGIGACPRPTSSYSFSP